MASNPYEADPAKIPEGDRYSDCPLYGRYLPQHDDFQPEADRINSASYWQENELDEDGRDVFALGSVIIKSGHLHNHPTRDYSLHDANEVAAVALARGPLEELGVKVPEIYFAGKIRGRDVLVQQRIPGVGLNIASQYLGHNEMDAFKKQARQVLERLSRIKPGEERQNRSYLVPDPDPVGRHRIRQQEADILFSERNQDGDLSFMHNDFTESNTIVDNGKLVGFVDWEMAGFFGWATARDVHEQIRSPRRETYAQLEGKKEYEDILRRIFFWNDLYASP